MPPWSRNANEMQLETLRTLARSPTRNVVRELVVLLLLFIIPLLAVELWWSEQAGGRLERSELSSDLLRARTLAALAKREFVASHPHRGRPRVQSRTARRLAANGRL